MGVNNQVRSPSRSYGKIRSERVRSRAVSWEAKGLLFWSLSLF
jgi:hypothetical protein